MVYFFDRERGQKNLYDLRVELYDLRVLFHKKAVLLCVYLNRKITHPPHWADQKQCQTISNNIKHMRKIITFFAALLLVSAAWAQEEQAPVQKLNVHMMDGSQLQFLLTDEPVTTFENRNLVITTNQGVYSYPLAQMKKYTHEGLPEGIDLPTVAPGDILVRRNNEMMLIDGLLNNTQVEVYSADGKLILSQHAVGGQSTLLNLANQPQGTYIVNVGQTSFKFVKQ